MIIDQIFCDELFAQTKANPRLRLNFNLRTYPSDNSQRMLNALEPGIMMPIHRHRGNSDNVVIILGRMIEQFYDELGNLTEEVLMYPGCDTLMDNVERVDGTTLNAWYPTP